VALRRFDCGHAALSIGTYLILNGIVLRVTGPPLVGTATRWIS
jgi:hypothetical protein